MANGLWLGIATSIIPKEEVAWEFDEAHQLKAMITAAIKTAQSSSSRGRQPSTMSHEP
jgi:hypothetical protein